MSRHPKKRKEQVYEPPTVAPTLKPLCIIPAAGFGTRAGQLPSEAKELLIDPMTGKPLICWAIEHAINAGLTPLVITRREKQALRIFLEATYNAQKMPAVKILVLDEPSREWPETILKSAEYWRERNLLLLPDIRFEPSAFMIRDLVNQLHPELTPVAFAGAKVLEPQKFGVLSRGMVAEKPKDGWAPNAKAWCLIAFNKEFGKKLFTHFLEERGEWLTLPTFAPILDVDWFADVTRNGRHVDPY